MCISIINFDNSKKNARESKNYFDKRAFYFTLIICPIFIREACFCVKPFSLHI